MKRMKKLTSMLLALSLSAGIFTGCNSGGGTKITLEDKDKCPDSRYEINWYLMSENQSDVHSVEDKINEYLKDKLNVTVKMNCLPSAQYQQKLSTMINANEYFDMCFVARWMLNYVDNARADAFVPLDDYLDTYLKEASEAIGDEVLDCSRVDGKLCALPVNKEMATQYGWIYRKDIAEKYGIDMTKYKSFEELEPVLKMLKEKEKDIKYPLDWTVDATPATLYVHENYVFKDGTYPDTETVNFFKTPEFKKAVETARDFYNKGYVRPDVLTATDQLQRMDEGKTFVMLQPLKPGKAKELFKASSYDFEQAEVTDAIIDYHAGTGSMTAVSASSKNPVRVMRFLNLLNSDKYLKNLVVHGIEGKHYNKSDENTVDPIVGSGYDLYSDSWAIGNVFLDYLTKNEDPNKLVKLKEFNDSAKPAKVNKFWLVQDAEMERVSTEISNVQDKYYKQLVMGVVDPSVIDEFNAQLEKVGINEQIEKVNKQYQEFLKAQK